MVGHAPLERSIGVRVPDPQPNSSTNGIQEGTKSVTIIGAAGQTISTTTYPVISGTVSSIITSQTTYSNFDVQNRAQRIDYLDGTYETMSYACCGLDTKTDRDGVMTQYFYDDMKRMTNQVRLGISMFYTYDGAGRVIKTTRKGTDGSSIVLSQTGYDLAGRMIATTNAVGVITAYSEGTNGLGQVVKTTTYASGTADATTRIETYALDGSLAKVTGTGVASPVRYDSGVEQDGGVWRSYRKEIKLDVSGNDTSEWSKTYADFAGRSYKMVSSAASGTPASQTYFNDLGQVVQQVDPDGVSTLLSYNLQGEPLYTCLDTNRNGSIETNGLDRVTWTINDVLYNSTLGYNVRRSRTFTHPDANSTNILEVSRTETSTDGLRSWTTSFGLTNSGQTVYGTGGMRTNTVTNVDNSSTVTVYQNGRLSTVTRKDSTGAQLSQVTYAYDVHGRQSSVTDARSGTTTSAYDAADRVIATTSPPPGTGQSAQTVTPIFDNLGRVVKITQPDGSSVTNEYYLTGLLKRTYGTRTYPVGYGYDAQGRMIKMTNWTSFTSSAGTRVTTWNYDTYTGLLSSKRDDSNQGSDYAYTTAGRLLTRKWARGSPRIVTTNVYDNLGQLSSVSYLNDPNSTPGITFGYDRRGQKGQSVMNSITTTYYYSSAGLPTGESYSGGTLNGLAMTNLYDLYLRRTNVQLVGQSATINAYTYDNASRLASIGDGTYSANYTRLANSELLDTVTFKQSSTTRMTTTRQYDKLNRLLNITSNPGGTPSSASVAYAYTYNDANQRISVMLADGSYWIYQYDQLGQVVSGKRFWSDGTPVAGQQYEYGFDDIGNRTTAKAGGDSTGANLRLATYTVNNLNQYSSRTVPGGFDVIGLANVNASVAVSGSAADYRRGEYFQESVSVNNASAAVWQSVVVTNSGSGSSASGNVFVAKTPENYTYDLDGNTLTDGRWNYTWNGENRLIQVDSLATDPTASKRKVVWEFDCQGRRIRQTTYDGSSGSYVVVEDLKFISDGWRHLAELNATNNALVRSYVWGLDLSGSLGGAGGVGGLVLFKSVANGAHFYAYDGNGNTAALVRGTDGTVSANYEYGTFGQTLRVTGLMAKENPFRFSTKRTENTCEIVLYEHRPYSASQGRFINQDPAGENGGKNVYAILQNDVQNYLDYLGMWESSVHYDIVDKWLDPSYETYSWRSCTVNVRQILKDASDEIDGIGGHLINFAKAQSISTAYQHAMAKPGETVAIAQSRYDGFVKGHLDQAKQLGDKARASQSPGSCCLLASAIRHIGYAYHGVSDNESPSHKGFQIWDPLNPGLVRNHVNGETFDVYRDVALGVTKSVAAQLDPFLQYVLAAIVK